MLITSELKSQAVEFAKELDKIFDAKIEVVGCWIYLYFSFVPADIVREELKTRGLNWCAKKCAWVYSKLLPCKGKGKAISVLRHQFGVYYNNFESV